MQGSIVCAILLIISMIIKTIHFYPADNECNAPFSCCQKFLRKLSRLVFSSVIPNLSVLIRYFRLVMAALLTQ